MYSVFYMFKYKMVGYKIVMVRYKIVTVRYKIVKVRCKIISICYKIVVVKSTDGLTPTGVWWNVFPCLILICFYNHKMIVHISKFSERR